LPNVQTAGSEAFYRSFRARYPQAADDYVHMRMQLMVEALAQAIEKAGQGAPKSPATALDLIAVAAQLERANVTFQGQNGAMRTADHQFQQPLVVGVMDRQGTPGVKFDVEGSGYGFRVVKTIPAAGAEQATTCKMQRPG
jgi:branched-chain amino acid transport system substrate-binding protein